MTSKKGTLRPPKKRAYRAPKLTTHGDLKTMTLAKGGALADNVGNPKTRTVAHPSGG